MKIAVLIDFDNIEIGVKTTLNREFDVGAVLDAVKERGEVITKIAYGDWKRAGDYSRMLTQHAVRMVQRNMTPGGDKNGADINLALDALEMAFTHDHINAFVIVGGDSDFISLVEKLKQYDKKVFVVGGRQFTGAVMQKNCHEFIAYENLIRQPSRRQPAAQGRERGGGQAAAAARDAVGGARQQGVRAGDPRARAADRPRGDAAAGPAEEHAAAARLDLLRARLRRLELPRLRREAGRGGPGHAAQLGPQRACRAEGRRRPAGRRARRRRSRTSERRERRGAPAAAGAEADAPAEPRGEAPQTSIVDGIRLLQRVLATPGAIARWPMYVRNVKQAMRAADAGFDERKHGNLVEILRSVQRDGLVRLDRDRQGVLRVFQGPQLRLPVAPPQESVRRDRPRAKSPATVEPAPVTARPRRTPAGPARRQAPPRSPAQIRPAPTWPCPRVPRPPSQASPTRRLPPRRRRRAAAARPRRQPPGPGRPRPASRGRARPLRAREDTETE